MDNCLKSIGRDILEMSRSGIINVRPHVRLDAAVTGGEPAIYRLSSARRSCFGDAGRSWRPRQTTSAKMR